MAYFVYFDHIHASVASFLVSILSSSLLLGALLGQGTILILYLAVSTSVFSTSDLGTTSSTQGDGW